MRAVFIFWKIFYCVISVMKQNAAMMMNFDLLTETFSTLSSQILRSCILVSFLSLYQGLDEFFCHGKFELLVGLVSVVPFSLVQINGAPNHKIVCFRISHKLTESMEQTLFLSVSMDSFRHCKFFYSIWQSWETFCDYNEWLVVICFHLNLTLQINFASREFCFAIYVKYKK